MSKENKSGFKKIEGINISTHDLVPENGNINSEHIKKVLKEKNYKSRHAEDSQEVKIEKDAKPEIDKKKESTQKEL